MKGNQMNAPQGPLARRISKPELPQRIPEWRRRAIEAVQLKGFVAAKELAK